MRELKLGDYVRILPSDELINLPDDYTHKHQIGKLGRITRIYEETGQYLKHYELEHWLCFLRHELMYCHEGVVK